MLPRFYLRWRASTNHSKFRIKKNIIKCEQAHKCELNAGLDNFILVCLIGGG